MRRFPLRASKVRVVRQDLPKEMERMTSRGTRKEWQLLIPSES